MISLSPGELRKRLERILGDSVRQAENLSNALQQELVALTANDAGCLALATAAKSEPIARLAVLESERAVVSGEAGFDASPAGMEALFKACDENSQLAGLWHRLIAMAGTCEQRNATNGGIIRLRRQQVLAGLAILRGGEIAAETYVRAGIESTLSGRRALAQARTGLRLSDEAMLIVTRRDAESIEIRPGDGTDPNMTLGDLFRAGPIEIRIFSSGSNRVKLGVQAPSQLAIWRKGRDQQA